jgi:hypothetical protein
MKRLALLCLIILTTAFCSYSQLNSVVVETSYNGGLIACGTSDQPAGTITYRVYAQLEDADDFLSAITAIEGCHPMNISTSTSFYNSAAGGVLGSDLNAALCPSISGAGYDSFLTIGQATSADAGQTQAVFSNPTDPISVAFATENGTNFLVNDGTIFTTNGSVNGLPTGPNNRVLLGQFTTDGDFSFDINLQVFDGGNGSQNLVYISSGGVDCFFDSANPFPNMPTVIDGSTLGLIYDAFPGCTDPSASNYDASANVENGTCTYAIAGCTDPSAINYDANATSDDGSCFYVATNDTPETAESMGLNIAAGPGTGCSGLNEQNMFLANANTSSNIPSSLYNNLPGLWYSFVPFSSGNQITVETEDFDAVIELYDINLGQVNGINDLPLENANDGTGNEIFQVGNLTAGQPYFVRVVSTTPITEDALFNICVQTFRDTRCDYPSGTYSLCQMYKADFVYSDAYQFHFTSQSTGEVYSSDVQSSTFLVLRNVDGLLFGDDYTVEIESIYYMLDGAGNQETVVVANDEPCTITIGDVPVIKMRTQDNIANHGPHYPGNFIRTNQYACSATAYTWRFIRVDLPELPQEYTSATSSTFVRISDVLGNSIAPGGIYDVQVKPVFANGQEAIYGEAEQIALVGAAGIIGDVIVANDITEDGQKDEVVDVLESNIYPNPSNGLVNVSLNYLQEEDAIELSVTDFVGRTVASQQLVAQDKRMQIQMDLSTLAAGTYLVHIKAGKAVFTEKLVIVN